MPQGGKNARSWLQLYQIVSRKRTSPHLLKQINADVDLAVFLAALVPFSVALATLLNIGFPVDIPGRQKKWSI